MCTGSEETPSRWSASWSMCCAGRAMLWCHRSTANSDSHRCEISVEAASLDYVHSAALLRNWLRCILTAFPAAMWTSATHLKENFMESSKSPLYRLSLIRHPDKPLWGISRLATQKPVFLICRKCSRKATRNTWAERKCTLNKGWGSCGLDKVRRIGVGVLVRWSIAVRNCSYGGDSSSSPGLVLLSCSCNHQLRGSVPQGWIDRQFTLSATWIVVPRILCRSPGTEFQSCDRSSTGSWCQSCNFRGAHLSSDGEEGAVRDYHFHHLVVEAGASGCHRRRIDHRVVEHLPGVQADRVVGAEGWNFQLDGAARSGEHSRRGSEEAGRDFEWGTEADFLLTTPLITNSVNLMFLVTIV